MSATLVLKRLLLGALFVPLFALPFVTIWTTRVEMDAITGSLERRTIWPFGISIGPRVERSPIEIRLNKMGVHWRRDWRFMSETGHGLLGAPTFRGCGSAPPIIELEPMQRAFASRASDAEVRDLLRVIQSGTPAPQRAAIEDIAEKF